MALPIKIQSKKFIKPATPTPAALRYCKIGSIDESAPGLNIGVVLFFSVDKNQEKFVAHLENSLEKTLPRFYPLAGRYRQDIHDVDCSDQGVEFKHAKANIKLEEILGDSHVNLRFADSLKPSELGAVDLETDPMLAIQLTTFDCGGVALSVSATHRIVDASTLCTFLNHWASINRQENNVDFINATGFISSSFFPPRGLLPIQVGLSRTSDVLNKYVTKKISFTNNDISKLNEKILMLNANDTRKRSKVQIASTLICNILISIDRRTIGYPRDCVLLQPINLRGKTQTLIPNDACGNLSALLATECKSGVETAQELADVIRDSIKDVRHSYSKLRLDDEDAQTMVINSLTYFTTIPQHKNIIVITSWCNFPFYEANFGFGKPLLVNCGSMYAKNSGFLIDGVGGDGVDAYVGLENTDVPYFEQALKAFGV